MLPVAMAILAGTPLVAAALVPGEGAPDVAPLDPDEFERLLRPLLPKAYAIALHLAHDRADAEDLVQDASLNALRGLATFRQGTNFKAWFFRILYNCFYSSHRRHGGDQGMLGLEDASEHYLMLRVMESGADLSGDPVADTVGRLQAEQVSAALRMLPEEYRVVCTMYFIDDAAYQDIADTLGIPVGTVRSRLHRGRRMLQKQLWALALDQGLVAETATAVPGGTP
ncbi:MAG TPA: sigma-70 family RNA polymerase sigma factor [Gemmatimonadaceae bacterium]